MAWLFLRPSRGGGDDHDYGNNEDDGVDEIDGGEDESKHVDELLHGPLPAHGAECSGPTGGSRHSNCTDIAENEEIETNVGGLS